MLVALLGRFWRFARAHWARGCRRRLARDGRGDGLHARETEAQRLRVAWCESSGAVQVLKGRRVERHSHVSDGQNGERCPGGSRARGRGCEVAWCC